jgi:hypothetical protein
MPTPTIPDGELFFNATLYSGTGATQTITNGVAGQSFQPDFVWIKARSTTTNNRLYDSVRGATLHIQSNTTDAETTNANGLTAFVSNGFTVGSASSENASGQTFVAWNWKAGGAAVTNTAGTISAQVSANTTSGFSVVTYTGNGTNGATVGHGLGVAPSMIFVKDRTQGGTYRDWAVYSPIIGAGNSMYLNSTSGSFSKPSYWNSTTATSSVFTLGNDITVNQSGDAFVAYCWAPIAGYSAFGSYTGNGSTDGPFLYMGFRPRFYMYKRADSTSNWVIMDTSRNPFNTAGKWLYPNLVNAENDVVSTDQWDFLSNGLKVRSNGSATNASGGTYIYAAFAENPFKYANAR